MHPPFDNFTFVAITAITDVKFMANERAMTFMKFYFCGFFSFISIPLFYAFPSALLPSTINYFNYLMGGPPMMKSMALTLINNKSY